MRPAILAAAKDLLADANEKYREEPISLDEIAANAGITYDQLRAYYTSVDAIVEDLKSSSSERQVLTSPDAWRFEPGK